MHHYKLITPVLLFLATLANAETDNAAGTIYIREMNPSIQCSISATPGDYVIENHGCTNDQAYGVRFQGIPSAVNITFFDDKDGNGCLDNEGWEIEVRTVKNPTTTPEEPYMDLEGMFGAPPGAIIQPGVLKIRQLAGGQVRGKLSCIRVENNK